MEEVIARRDTHEKGDKDREKKYVSKNEVSEVLYHALLTRDKAVIECAFVEYNKDICCYRAHKNYGLLEVLFTSIPETRN